jgi:hypothetical protein
VTDRVIQQAMAQVLTPVFDPGFSDNIFGVRPGHNGQFLWLVLRHVLPRGFRRARNHGFLHPNSKTLIKLIHWILKFDPGRCLPKSKPRPQLRCDDCGGLMVIISTRTKPELKPIDPIPIQGTLVF